jgi:glyoxylase-like metal-dependent hydrolase (beta-lactamase superfamily II)
VSAYVLVRGKEAAVVDTSVTGSVTQIGDALVAAGSSWGAVRHVILTHQHPDHVGSVAAGGRGLRAAVHGRQAAAVESVEKLAAVQFETLAFGHGEPIESDADAAVAALAATL